MLSANPSCSKLSIVTLALGMIAVFGLPLRAQEAPAVHVGNTLITGLPDDWSHHHQVFSNPGTEQDAIKNGTHDRWLKTVNDPRYVIHQLKRGLPVQGPAAQDVEMWRRIAAQDAAMRDSWDGRKHKNPTPNPNNPSLDKDWSMSLGSGGFLKAGQYPAKYNFGISTAPCSDFVVYPTGLAGGAAQATVVAYNNIYNNSTCTGLGAVPLINWAYNTGGTANLSPIISSNGTQVAYIQTASSVASLVLLKPGPNTTGRTVTGTLAASSPEVTLSSGTFTAADVGVQITGTGITAGDTIATVLRGCD